LKRLELKGLAALQAELPSTMMARVRLAWPEIQAALERGHRLKDVHASLRDAGIEIGYRRLSEYIGLIRGTAGKRRTPRRGAEKATQVHASATASKSIPIEQSSSGQPVDPLINLRQPKSPRTFEYPSGPPDESKLI